MVFKDICLMACPTFSPVINLTENLWDILKKGGSHLLLRMDLEMNLVNYNSSHCYNNYTVYKFLFL